MLKTALFHKQGGPPLSRIGLRGYLSSEDALDFSQRIRSESADVVFLDPPFNLGKDYGFDSVLETTDPVTYSEYIRSVIEESARVLKPGGALFLYHIPYWAAIFANVLNSHLDFRHWIAVSMKNGFVRRDGLYPAHYALLYYTKGVPAHIRRPRLQPKTCRHCGELIKDYGGYTDIIQKKGINVSDIWDDLSPVRHRSRKLRKANQLPIALTDRVLAISGHVGGVLIDPFVGTGTSLISATKARMNFLGNDLHPQNIELCKERLKAAK